VLLIPLFLLLWVVLPITPAAAQTDAWQPDEFVELVPRDGRPGIVNNHPLKIDAQTLSTLLRAIRILPKDLAADDDEKPQRLFSQSKANYLGAELSAAFREAGPNEDIVFQTADTARLIGKLVKKPVYTLGRVFWKNRRLQIIFGSVQRGVARRWRLGQEVGYVNTPQMGSRTAVVSSDYDIVLFPGSEYAKTQSGGTRSDWLIIDPRATLSSQRAEAQSEQRDRNTQDRGMRDRDWEDRRTRDSGSRAAEANDSPSRRSLEARLKYLKDLRQKGLISEADYRDKVRSIIDQL